MSWFHLGRPPGEGPTRATQTKASLGETVDLLRRYVVQETVGPLKHLGKVLAWGAGGALAFGAGGLFLVVGALRLIEAESGTLFGGSWSFAPYLLAAVVGLLAIGLFALTGLQGLRSATRADEREGSRKS